MSYELISNLVMLSGFVVTGYATVANNTPQTLGPFIRSNPSRPWWMLWLFASVVMLSVMAIGWIANGGDVCYGRLDAIPLPDRYTWIHLIPPLALLGLTRFGIPVSPTFLIIPAFATAALSPMLRNAAIGYLGGFIASLAFYRVLLPVERKFMATSDHGRKPLWLVVQLFSTALLWSQWLIQNLANVYAYVPRQLTLRDVGLCGAVLVALLAIVLRSRGGATQRIVKSKTNLGDIRSATLLDLLYGSLLLALLWTSKVPMSTTWVFLGTIGAREIALNPKRKHATRMLGRELALALIGLAISLALALVLPMFHQSVDRTFNFDGDVTAPTASTQ